MKTCKKCETEKLLEQFSPHKNTADRLSTICKQCNSKRTREYQKKNTQIYKNGYINQGIKRHGITIDQYNLMLISQNGVCKICKRSENGKRLSIDHDHTCCAGSYSCGSCIRGLLCMNCNTMIGSIEKAKINLNELSKYLFTSVTQSG